MAQDYDQSIFEKKRLEMSEFIARELLYDYVMGRLDPARKKSVEEMLAHSTKNQQDLERLKAGIDYCRDIANTEVSESLLRELAESRTLWKNFLRLLDARNWPPPVRWSMEGLAIAVFVGILVANLPLKKMFYGDRPDALLTTKVSRGVKTPGETAIKNRMPHLASVPDEGEKTPVVKKTKEAKEKAVVAGKKVAIQKKEPVASVASAEKANKKDAKEPKARVAENAQPTVVPSRPRPANAGPGNAFVYRLYIYPKDVDSIQPNVVRDIRSMKGERAGEVELGWKKGNGRYYHFKMLSENHDQLIDKLKAYGSIRIRKSKHTRVMPKHEFRYILWMEVRNQ